MVLWWAILSTFLLFTMIGLYIANDGDKDAETDKRVASDKQLKEVKEQLAASLTRNIYITLNDAQLVQIAHMVADKLKEPKQWLN